MICNVCGTNEATIHLTEIINEQMVEVHLCETCAQEKGTEFKTHFNVSDLLSGLADLAKEIGGEERVLSKCPNCGLSYEEFGRTGRLGCAECYEAFSKFLLPLIKRVQHSTQHTGKRPSRLAAPSARSQNQQDLRDLQNRLVKLIQKEEFEEAARLRDQIRQLEEKIKKPKKKSHE